MALMKKIFEKTVFPNGKLNLYLEITGKRSDGYHLLDTIMVPINIYDQLDIILYEAGDISLRVGGTDLDCSCDDNLVVKAAKAYQKAFHVNFGMSATLTKKIPVGAGLGGGSSDAAFCLNLLNEHFQCANEGELIKIAADLGADVPFFIVNRPAFCQGIGDEIYPIEIPEMNLTLFVPKYHCNTGKIFQNMKKFLTPNEIFGKTLLPDGVIWKQVTAYHKTFFNKLEKVVLLSDPDLGVFKRNLERILDCTLHMTGSGCAFYTKGTYEIEMEGVRSFKIQFSNIGASSSG